MGHFRPKRADCDFDGGVKMALVDKSGGDNRHSSLSRQFARSEPSAALSGRLCVDLYSLNPPPFSRRSFGQGDQNDNRAEN
jgi:hypothetical protein